ncbi:alpha/beta fold hydrolase [Nocardiopsis sp. YSL2]|uniref:alpha/beta fold hydrolase n=1 Tax=Nocardiopsis sp. YSL2 TaxID=2939492 RepID=UPI0026F453DD|nr:alpha/beta fold hydrolase [Nocardiopsis sp. YSL2]
MTTSVMKESTLSRGVRRISLETEEAPVSGLLLEPEDAPARAAVIAVHGGGVNAHYFDGQAHPQVSLLALGARLGFSVLAVDRPGYGRYADRFPLGQRLVDQAATLREALHDFRTRHDTGAGMFLLAHSYGGKLALTTAADDTAGDLLGLDISGMGHRYAVHPDQLADPHGKGRWERTWGGLGLYPPGTFQLSSTMVSPMPRNELTDAAAWPRLFDGVAGQIRIPVRLTFAEHEHWWRHDDQSLADLVSRLSGAPRVVVDRQPNAGHNISLGWAARSYHLRSIAFLEDCLAQREG